MLRWPDRWRGPCADCPARVTRRTVRPETGHATVTAVNRLRVHRVNPSQPDPVAHARSNQSASPDPARAGTPHARRARSDHGALPTVRRRVHPTMRALPTVRAPDPRPTPRPTHAAPTCLGARRPIARAPITRPRAARTRSRAAPEPDRAARPRTHPNPTMRPDPDRVCASGDRAFRSRRSPIVRAPACRTPAPAAPVRCCPETGHCDHLDLCPAGD